jgi:4-hydroxybenzoate polyprenyltransferase
VRGDFGWIPGLMMIAVGSWIAGFDVLYALADLDFDRTAGLHSIPARLGVRGSLVVSAALHAVTVAVLALLLPVAGLGVVYGAGVAVVAALLLWEHWIVRPTDLSRLGMAFFNLNGYVSVAYLIAVVTDVLIR